MTPGWISGFTEGDGSFYITIKDKTVGRYSHGYGFSQKLDHNVLNAIAIIIGLSLRSRLKKQGYYIQDLTGLKDM